MATRTNKKYLLYFAQEHLDFRFAEIESIFTVFNLGKLKYEALENRHQPYWFVELENENQARNIASRSLSLRFILEVWSHGKDFSSFHENLKKFAENSTSFSQYSNKSFKISVETYNKHFSQSEKIDKIESINYLDFRGIVDLKNPEVLWWYVEYYGLDPNKVSENPEQIIFGRWIADGQRHLLKEISLKTRKFIGNTSMDPQLSLLMANQGLCKKGSLVFDPFVGTGSMLISAAKFGSFVMGSDIDFLMLHGKTRPSRISQKVRETDESVLANLKQYNLSHLYLDVLISDFSNSVWSSNIYFDAIITDPPYGIREALERVEFKRGKKSTALREDTIHYPSTSNYSLSSLYKDLLSFSAAHLVMGGRLVCWIPFHKNDYKESLIPAHPCLKLIANSEQTLCGLTTRRLVTYEKIANYSPENTEAVVIDDALNVCFREKYFSQGEGTRKERRMIIHQKREMDKQEALKRGKMLDEHGNVMKKNKSNPVDGN